MMIAMAVLVCMGASTAPAAVKKVGPPVKLADDGTWEVTIKVFFLDGTKGEGKQASRMLRVPTDD